jgi:hypothetical protein
MEVSTVSGIEIDCNVPDETSPNTDPAATMSVSALAVGIPFIVHVSWVASPGNLEAILGPAVALPIPRQS